MAIYTVVSSVDSPPDKPFPARRIARIQGRMPVLIPAQQIGVFFKILGKMLQAKPLIDLRVRHIGLRNKWRWGINILFFPPVHGNLRFTQLERLLRLAHASPSLTGDLSMSMSLVSTCKRGRRPGY